MELVQILLGILCKGPVFSSFVYNATSTLAFSISLSMDKATLGNLRIFLQASRVCE